VPATGLASRPNVELVAMADAFERSLQGQSYELEKGI